MRCTPLFAIALLAPVAGSSDEPPAGAQDQHQQEPEPTPFDDTIRDYENWTNVYYTLLDAPRLCDLESALHAAGRTSEAPDGSPHGRKLYALRVSELEAFIHCNDAEPPIGFSAVKVSFAPSDDPNLPHGDFIGLFIMKRVGDADDANSDEGWLYATADADLKITEMGRIASCMGCHAKAPFHRLYGPKEEDHRHPPPPADDPSE